MTIIFGIFFVLASALILYLFAVGNWLLASIFALGLFILYVELERKEAEKAHAAAMKAERDREQGAADAYERLLHVQFDPDVLEVNAGEVRAEQLAEALRLIESAKDRGFGIDYARGVAQSALRDHDQEVGNG